MNTDLSAMADELPQRRLRLQLDLQADDLHEMAGALQSLAVDLEVDGREQREVTTGSYAWGGHLTLDVDEDQDHDRYYAQLRAWMQQRQAVPTDA